MMGSRRQDCLGTDGGICLASAVTPDQGARELDFPPSARPGFGLHLLQEGQELLEELPGTAKRLHDGGNDVGRRFAARGELPVRIGLQLLSGGSRETIGGCRSVDECLRSGMSDGAVDHLLFTSGEEVNVRSSNLRESGSVHEAWFLTRAETSGTDA